MLVKLSLVSVALAGLVAAQNSTATSSGATPVSTASVPACALSCLTDVLPSSPCASTGITGLDCICTSGEFQAAYYECQQRSCSSTAQISAAEQYGATICEQNGTPIDINAVPSGVSSAANPSSTGPTANQTGSSSASSTSAASTSASVAPSSAAGSVAPSASPTGAAGKNSVAAAAAILAAVGAVAVGAF
ncbi:hypothetical protein JCM8097_008463 [Rhodosporidiobolus ruineniae]